MRDRKVHGWGQGPRLGRPRHRLHLLQPVPAAEEGEAVAEAAVVARKLQVLPRAWRIPLNVSDLLSERGRETSVGNAYFIFLCADVGFRDPWPMTHSEK